MYPDELDSFYKTGQPPLERRPCIMCCRYAVHRFVYALSSISPTAWKRDKSFIPQCYTNLVNCPGGYQSQYAMLPSADQPVLVGPVAKSYLLYMRVKRRANTSQWVIDQSALVWHNPCKDTPRVGETVTSFRERVVQRLAKDGHGRSLADAEHTPSMRRLLMIYELGALRADLSRLDTRSRELCQWRARIASIRELTDVPACLYDIVCQECGLRTISETCLVYNPRCRHGIHSHIVSKSSPQPCQTRMMGEAIMAAMNFLPTRRKRTKQKRQTIAEILSEFTDRHRPKKTPDQQLFLQWITSSLMGLLPGHLVHPPIAVVVAWLDMIHSGQYKGVTHVLATVNHLCAFAIRERWCHIADNCAALKDDMASLFNYDMFSSIVRDTMNATRQALSTLTDPDVTVDDVYSVLTSTAVRNLLESAHTSMLVVSYQRAREPLMDTLSSCNREKRGAFVARATTDAKLVGEPGLPIEKLQLLRTWLWKLDPAQHSLETDVWPHLHMFGASPIGLNHIADICRRWEHERLGKRELKRLVDVLCVRAPETLYLCQVVSYFWQKRCHPFSVMLPANALKQQTAAVAARLGINGPQMGVTELRGCFYWCSVCQTPYSLMRTTDTPPNSETLIEAAKTFVRRGTCVTQPYGLTCARHDYRSGLNYCNKDGCSGYMRCGDQPLEATPLIGQRLTFANGLCVQICAQKGCGLAMQLSRLNSKWNENGPMCSACDLQDTVADIQARLEPWRMAYGTAFDCVMCEVSPKAHRTFYYGMDIFVCATHNNARVLEAVKKLENTAYDSKENRITAIVTVHQQIKDEMRRRKLNGMRAALKQSRRQTRGKRLAVKYI